jgi:hypothetical protein
MTKRQVQQALVSYRDTDGVWRHALAGETVDVDPGDVDRFDKLNYGDKYKPLRKRGPATQEPSPTSRRSTKKAAAKKAGRAPTPRK